MVLINLIFVCDVQSNIELCFIRFCCRWEGSPRATAEIISGQLRILYLRNGTTWRKMTGNRQSVLFVWRPHIMLFSSSVHPMTRGAALICVIPVSANLTALTFSRSIMPSQQSQPLWNPRSTC